MSLATGIYNGADVYKKKAWMILSIISNLSLLGFFKYWDLFATTLNHFTGWFFCGGASATVSPKVLPVLSLGAARGHFLLHVSEYELLPLIFIGARPSRFLIFGGLPVMSLYFHN